MPLFMDIHNHIEGLTADAAEAAIAVHREAHGLLADDLIEVKEGA
jgi:hypothetical protein